MMPIIAMEVILKIKQIKKIKIIPIDKKNLKKILAKK